MSATAYTNGLSLWRAVSDRARVVSTSTGQPASALVRRFVYDRFLARVFADPDGPWVLKGGTAVLARVHDARHSKDVDLLNRLGSLEDALQGLRAAVAVDLGDYFRFQLGVERQLGGAGQPDVTGRRLKVDAYCGQRRCESFWVDLVVGSLVTAEPDLVRSSLQLHIPGVSAPTVRAYPVVDHIADKVAATEAVYAAGAPSSRSRDLVDLVVLALTQAVDGTALHHAIAAERLNRHLPHRDTFVVPDAWATTYPALAVDTPHCAGLHELTAAVGLVASFLEPAMSGAAIGQHWEPAGRHWTSRLPA